MHRNIRLLKQEINQGIASVLMLAALLVTYLLHLRLMIVV